MRFRPSADFQYHKFLDICLYKHASEYFEIIDLQKVDIAFELILLKKSYPTSYTTFKTARHRLENVLSHRRSIAKLEIVTHKVIPSFVLS